MLNWLVLRRNRIVIPSKLRKKAVDATHRGHQGIVKTLKAANQRQSVVPRNRQASSRKGQTLPFISSCFTQITTARTALNDSLPSAPWKKVAVGFAGPFPSGDYIMVVTDEF